MTYNVTNNIKWDNVNQIFHFKKKKRIKKNRKEWNCKNVLFSILEGQ